MRKNIYITLFLLLMCAQFCFASLFQKKEKPLLYFTPFDPRTYVQYDAKIEPVNVFRKGDRIYFSVYTKNGFKSDYIKYQIVKQDNNAHIGGYSRYSNKTVKTFDKNYYIDYFVINSSGKYFLQVFDLENLNQWIVMGAFAVVD